LGKVYRHLAFCDRCGVGFEPDAAWGSDPKPLVLLAEDMSTAIEHLKLLDHKRPRRHCSQPQSVTSRGALWMRILVPEISRTQLWGGARHSFSTMRRISSPLKSQRTALRRNGPPAPSGGVTSRIGSPNAHRTTRVRMARNVPARTSGCSSPKSNVPKEKPFSSAFRCSAALRTESLDRNPRVTRSWHPPYS
jgi:hypothetical protein